MKFRIRQVYEKKKDSFEGIYKGHHIHCYVDTENGCWYIIVTDKTGMTAYDGWWRDSEDKSVDHAIEEALRGSMLLKESK